MKLPNFETKAGRVFETPVKTLKHSNLDNLLHALRSLSGDLDGVDEFESGFVDVNVSVQRRALAPLRHDGQDLLGRDTTHEEQDVDMSRNAKRKVRFKNW